MEQPTGTEIGLFGLRLRDDFGDGARVRDVEVGRKLGMARPEDIRRTIHKYAEDLNDFGILARCAIIHEGAGRPSHEYWLNKDQALFVVGRSDTELGRATYKLIVRAFGAFLPGQVASVPPILQADFRPWAKTWQDDIARLLCELKVGRGLRRTPPALGCQSLR